MPARDTRNVEMTIVGIDCAVDPKNVGLARVSLTSSKPQLLSAQAGGGERTIAETVASWIRDSEQALLALDAPLGWPEPMGRTLVSHQAGQAVSETADALFRRATDVMVRERIGKQPLEVGANLIARTARAALALLEELRQITGKPIPLTWSPKMKQRVAAIEVYPAGTLKAHRLLPKSSYKQGADKTAIRENREKIIIGLAKHIRLGKYRPILLEEHDAIDAVACILAALDFLAEKSIKPTKMRLARKEGWIWVREPK